MSDPLKDIKRQLKIKTGTVTRIAKDIVYYQKEFDAQKARIEKIKADPTKDDHDVRKQEEVLAETEQMFPDAKARLSKALVDLEAAVVRCRHLPRLLERAAAPDCLSPASALPLSARDDACTDHRTAPRRPTARTARPVSAAAAQRRLRPIRHSPGRERGGGRHERDGGDEAGQGGPGEEQGLDGQSFRCPPQKEHADLARSDFWWPKMSYPPPMKRQDTAFELENLLRGSLDMSGSHDQEVINELATAAAKHSQSQPGTRNNSPVGSDDETPLPGQAYMVHEPPVGDIISGAKNIRFEERKGGGDEATSDDEAASRAAADHVGQVVNREAAAAAGTDSAGHKPTLKRYESFVQPVMRRPSLLPPSKTGDKKATPRVHYIEDPRGGDKDGPSLSSADRFRNQFDPQVWMTYFFTLHATVLHTIIVRVVMLTLFSAGVVVLHEYVVTIPPLADAPHIIMGAALGLLTTFRTNSSYIRFWEGRSTFAEIFATCIDVARSCQVWMRQGSLEQKTRICHLVLSFPFAVKRALRRETDIQELEMLWTCPRYRSLLRMKNIPAAIISAATQELELVVSEGHVDPNMASAINADLSKLVTLQMTAEKITLTPVPPVFAVEGSRYLFLFFVTLPFVLVNSLGWFTCLAVFILAYEFLGVEAIGTEVEDPFGRDFNDLELDAMCYEHHHAIIEMLSISQVYQQSGRLQRSMSSTENVGIRQRSVLSVNSTLSPEISPR